jgi:UDP-GlcNAc:undecaprenyl-phosphate GlcNAc-1-phosphate transferase
VKLAALLLVFASSLVLALLLTPLARTLASHFGLVDQPDGRRKIHGKPTPLAGGLVVLLALFGGVAVSLFGPGHADLWFAEQRLFLTGLLLASLIIGAVGLLDDSRGLRGRHKILGQLLAVGIVMSSGLVVERIRLFDWQLELGPLAVPFTIFWLLGSINSLNLLDGLDGLLSGVGLIISLAMTVMAMAGGHEAAACIAAALAGALVGFLRYNFPPATIFLGDSGSMLIGLVVGALALRCSLKAPATVALVAPLALLTIPAFDTAAAIIRRRLTGRSIYSTDRGHLHHCLLGRGFSTRRALLWISVSCLLTAAGALGSISFRSELFAVVTALAVIGVYIVSRLFGFAELMLVKNRIVSGAVSFLRVPPHGKARVTEIHLQGTADWGELWGKMTESARELDLRMIRLDVSVPALYEGYHAIWHHSQVDRSEDPHAWYAEIPLTVRGEAAGRLEVIGKRGPQPIWTQIATLMKLADGLEETIITLRSASPVLPGQKNQVTETDEALAGKTVWGLSDTNLATNGPLGK